MDHASGPATLSERLSYVTRVHLTARDAARIRVRPELSLLLESAHALEAVLSAPGRPGAGEWTRRTRVRLASLPYVRAELVRALELISCIPPWVDSPTDGNRFLQPPVPEPVRHAMRILARVGQVVVDPDRAQVCALQSLAAHRAGFRLAKEGAEATVRSLGEGCRWSENGLELDDGHDRTVDDPGDHGIVLFPSVFLATGPRVHQWADPGTGSTSTALLFPALGPGESLDSRLHALDRSQEALGRLLGRTRSAVLAELVTPASTGELARTLHVSATSVSEHTAALRDTGMITTNREGSRVQHLATDLGLALLDRCGTGASGQRFRVRARLTETV